MATPFMRSYITTWSVVATTTPAYTVTLPLNPLGSYNFYVNWGDGSAKQHITTAVATHTYASIATTYTVCIGGVFKGWGWGTAPTAGPISIAGRLQKVLSWGPQMFVASDPGGAFNNTLLLDTLPSSGTPRGLQGINSNRFLRLGSASITLSSIPNCNRWDTRYATNFITFFQLRTGFDGVGVGSWDVAMVTDMSFMFNQCSPTTFNPNFSSWNTANVTTMRVMFQICPAFTGTGVNLWNTANVTAMDNMFFRCTVFNQNLSTWNTANVTNMQNMLGACRDFNGSVANWKVGKVTSMAGTFQRSVATSMAFTGIGLDTWDWSPFTVSSTDMSFMFNQCASLNNPIGGSVAPYRWRVGKCTSFQNMFSGCTAFNGSGISNWDWSDGAPTTVLGNMFSSCPSLGSAFIGGDDISPLNSRFRIGNCINFSSVFDNCLGFLGNGISNWDWSGGGTATTFATMFRNCNALGTRSIGGNGVSPLNSRFRVGQSTTFQAMFDGCIGFLGNGISDWDWSDGPHTANLTMAQMFRGCSALGSALINIGGSVAPFRFRVGTCTSFSEMFSGCIGLLGNGISNWDWSDGTHITNFTMGSMFSGCTALGPGLISIGGSVAPFRFRVGKCTDFISMFSGCTALIGNGLSNWDWSDGPPASSVNTFMANMFFNCSSLAGSVAAPVSGFRVGRCTTFVQMFYGCTAFAGNGLSSWVWSDGPPASSANTSMSFMFYLCTSLTGSPTASVSGFRVGRCTDFENMFGNCTAFVGNGLNAWSWVDAPPTSSATVRMAGMFTNCGILTGNVSGFRVGRCNDFSSMFFNCSNFQGDGLSAWNWSDGIPTAGMGLMFFGCSKLGLAGQQVGGAAFPNQFRVGKITSMGSMFNSCTVFTGGGLNNWDWVNVPPANASTTTMFAMFNACTAKIQVSLAAFDSRSFSPAVGSNGFNSFMAGSGFLSTPDYNTTLAGMHTKILTTAPNYVPRILFVNFGSSVSSLSNTDRMFLTAPFPTGPGWLITDASV